MSATLTISCKEILHQIKLSCQIPSVIEGIITRKIIERAASEQGIKAQQEELQQAADSLRLINNLRSPNATWLWLQKHSLSLDNFEEIVYAAVISSKLAQHLFADKVESFFSEHQLDYASVVMYEVVLDDEDLAMELFCAIGKGKLNFSEVTHQYIQDPQLRRTGGYLGTLSYTELKPEISTAVFAATPPQILKPILTSQGAHLILVEELIQPELDDVLRHKIVSDLFYQWLNSQIEQFQAEIDWKSKELVVSNSEPLFLTFSS